ncbi:MAG: SDR family oxidoreductase [Alphaproteobacteria bacterium]
MALRSTALVAGATGAVGEPLATLLSATPGFRVVGLCRTPPADPGAITWVAADLLDAQACRAAVALAGDVTHVFYAARAPHGEGGRESVADNLAMLRNVLDAAEAAAPELAHVHLVEGGKWYGLHLGPYLTPAREDQPRHAPPNFYFDQEDLLVERRRGGAWTWSACRPNVVCDVAPGRGRNLVSTIGAYGAICRATGTPFDFPGTQAGWTTLTELTEARHLARAIRWMATQPACADRAFNVTNGDVFRWCDMWPAIADAIGVVPGGPRPFRLAEAMAGAEPEWDRIVTAHGLRPLPIERVANWGFADFVFGQDWDVASDLARLRATGFDEAVDTRAMIVGQLAAYRDARVLP